MRNPKTTKKNKKSMFGINDCHKPKTNRKKVINLKIH